jgi:hypothetical protein
MASRIKNQNPIQPALLRLALAAEHIVGWLTQSLSFMKALDFFIPSDSKNLFRQEDIQ